MKSHNRGILLRILISILYKANPEEVRLILIDPKMLELSVYEDIPHLLCPVITDMKKASNGLRWCVNEMERRYFLMAELGVRNLNGYNKKVLDSIKSGSPIKDPLWKKTGSWVNNLVVCILLRKPYDVYLSPFKAFTKKIVKEIIRY